MPRATTAAWLVMPPRTVRMPSAADVLGRGFKTDENDLLAAFLPRLGVGRREDDLAAGRARGGGKALADELALLEGGGVELRVEKRVEVARLDHEDGLLLGAHSLVNEVARDLQRGLGRALAVAGLEHVELLVLDRELHVLHVAVVRLERLANLLELLEDLGHDLGHLGDRHRGADAGDDVLALRVHEELAHQLLLAGGGVAREGDARAGVVVQIAERHHLDVDGGAPAVGDVVVAAIDVCARVVPAAEDGLDRLEKLFLGVGREVLADLRLVFGLELEGQFLEVVGAELDVLGDALLGLHVVDELLEVFLADLHDDVGEHLDEAAVAVPGPARVLGLRGERLDDSLVEAEVEDRVHHARHGGAGAGADGDEKRILRVAEFLAGGLFEAVDVFHDLRHDVVGDGLAVVVIAGAGFGGDREALRDRKAERGHFGEVCALSSEEFAHVGVTFGLTAAEEVNVFGVVHLVSIPY